jgi:hypothetical protein
MHTKNRVGMTEQAQKPLWRASSYTHGQDCVELAVIGEGVGIRDSKAPEEGHLTINPRSLAGLVVQIKAGKLDL